MISPLGFMSLVARVPSKDRFVALLANLNLDLLGDLERDVLDLAE